MSLLHDAYTAYLSGLTVMVDGKIKWEDGANVVWIEPIDAEQDMYNVITKSSELTITAYKKNVLHGERKVFCKKRLKSLHNFKEGKLDGVAKVWYKNGKIASKQYFDHGIEKGVSKFWYENGQQSYVKKFDDYGYIIFEKDWQNNGIPVFERHRKNNILHGKYTFWYTSGNKRFERNYKNGHRHGLHTEWFKSGYKKSEIKYRNGNKLCAKYFDEPNLIKRVIQKVKIKFK